ncbi:hypothetical protein G7085_20030 [Tessaracoccus sp. HDW20]|uniref:hypothetical protein n=1 Tax=Tessaracoccus coleopterorum TaxID=2714950 RepID=UPI0018D3445C|nr:hypothetical protein [Tessaracoccus coleopterorum]NHB86047.1 hypothetical protein [Tessaracoccus coleopterorum]
MQAPPRDTCPTRDTTVGAGHAGAMPEPTPNQHRSASGGISRRLLRDTSTMIELGRLLGYALLEVLTMLRWTCATLLSLLGIGSVARSFTALERGADRQRRWASERRGRALTTTYEAVGPTKGPA